MDADITQFDPIAEIDRYFDDSSLPTSQSPQAVVIAGGVAAGKTTLRRAQYSTGYVVLDAAEILLRLCQGEYLDFPVPLEEPMDWIGNGIAQRIFRERRNFVTEVIGADLAPLKNMLTAIQAAGYETHIVGITCSPDAAVERNANRSDDNISAYYAEAYHQRWILANVDS
jgi:predicted secreted protein